jgi:very-short-patch-repair endonuclease
MREGSKTFFARNLRRQDTIAENRLWEELRNRQLENHKFVRQFPIGPFIADFACREQKLVIEVDGATHSTEAETAQDHKRTAFLNEHGYDVLRFQNIEIQEGIDQVLTQIAEVLKA